MSESFPRQHARTRRFTVGAPRSVRISTDGNRVLFLRSRVAGDPNNALWLFDVAAGTEALIADPAALLSDEAAADLPPAERARRERARESGSGIVAYDATGDLAHACFALGGALFVASIDDAGGATVASWPTGGSVFDPRFAPDASMVAYVNGDALHIATVDADREVLADLSPTVSWGSAEFVAAEEMGRSRGFWWSPAGDRLIAARVDVAAVDQWYISAPVTPAVEPQAVRYPAAGTTNAEVALAFVDLDGATTPIDWAGTEFEYLADVVWRSNHPPRLMVQPRDQRSLVVLEVDPSTASVTERSRQSDPHWVELVPGVPSLSGDKLVTVVDVGDTRSLLLDGVNLVGDLQVRSVARVTTDRIWFTATTDSTQAHPYVLEVATGDVAELRAKPGMTSMVVGGAAAEPTIVFSHASLDHAGSKLIVASPHGEHQIESWAETPVLVPNVSLHVLGSRALASAVLLPHDHDGKTPLPVLLDPYGGPHAQRVQQAHNLYLTSQWFADQGFAVLVTDGRGTPARGGDFEREVYGDLAQPVLDDQVDALHAAAELYPQMDLSRVAIRGWSFGGYLAALAVLLRPDVFHAAIAGAPVTDWRLYDTHYTERYLGHPETEPDNYERCDLTPLAPKLSKPLLLIHGLADDNVVAAHTLQLSRALLEAGRPHQVLPLSGVTHMTPQESVAENLLKLQLSFLKDSLG